MGYQSKHHESNKDGVTRGWFRRAKGSRSDNKLPRGCQSSRSRSLLGRYEIGRCSSASFGRAPSTTLVVQKSRAKKAKGRGGVSHRKGTSYQVTAQTVDQGYLNPKKEMMKEGSDGGRERRSRLPR